MTIDPKPKVFQIGFNKTATTALFWLFENSGYPSMHSSGRKARRQGFKLIETLHPQAIIHHNIIAGRPPVEGFDDFYGFFDMEYDLPGEPVKLENFKLYDRIAVAYPVAKFILNIRDKQDWLRSRSRHNDGRYLRNAARRLQIPPEQLLEMWGDEFDRHNDDVKDYFLDEADRLFVFDVDRTPIEDLIAFCAPEIQLDAEHWQKKRVTDQVAEAKAWAV